MSLLSIFTDLDRLYESNEFSRWLDREALIKAIKSYGRDYNFDKYSDEQLYRVLERIQEESNEKAAMQEYSELLNNKQSTCSECGMQLNDGGTCPVCNDGEEDLLEDKLPIGTAFKWTSDSGKPIVRIMYTGIGKFIAIADDGVHGINNVLFTSKFKKHNGELYEVDSLEWTGKNYKVIGEVKSIGNIVDKYQQINENIIKENFTMNFQSVLEELDRLYEENVAKADQDVAEEAEKEAAITEAADEVVDEEEIEIEDDSVEEAEDEAESEIEAQFVLECTNCGGLVIKQDTELKVEEASDLANVDEPCQYCEEAAGYRLLGTLHPYVEDESNEDITEDEAVEDEPVEESLLGIDMPVNVDIEANGNNVPVLNTGLN